MHSDSQVMDPTAQLGRSELSSLSPSLDWVAELEMRHCMTTYDTSGSLNSLNSAIFSSPRGQVLISGGIGAFEVLSSSRYLFSLVFFVSPTLAKKILQRSFIY